MTIFGRGRSIVIGVAGRRSTTVEDAGRSESGTVVDGPNEKTGKIDEASEGDRRGETRIDDARRRRKMTTSTKVYST